MGERLDGELFYSTDGGETFRPLGEIKEIEVSDTAEEPVATLPYTSEMSFPLYLTYQSMKRLRKMWRHALSCQCRAIRRAKRKQKQARKAAKKARYA